MADTLTFKLAAWTGVSGRTLIQGVKWDGAQFFIAQADDVAGQTEQDVVLHRHNATFAYVDADTVKKAGHASSFGVQPTKDGTRIWLGHNTKGAGWFLYGTDDFHTVNIPNGDIAVDAAADLLCLRVGNRYRGYILSTVDDPEPVQLFDATIPAWGNRFQGHAIVQAVGGRVLLCVHRDMKTLGESKASWFTAQDGKLAASGSVDTTHMGDEAEGFLIYDGSVWVVKRVGGNNANRTVRATRTGWQVDPNPKDQDANEETDVQTKYGWTASKDPVAGWGGNATIDVYGTKFHVRRDLYIGTKDGIVADLFRYLLFSYNRRVERISEYAAGDDYSYYFKLNANDHNAYSEHAGGWAVDINATQHPNGASSKYVGFTKAQVAEIGKILGEMEHVMEWGGNWHATIDGMHWNSAPDGPTDAGKKKIARVVGNLRKVMQADPTNYGLAPQDPPTPPPAKVQVSLKVIQDALKTGGDAAQDGREVQSALNKATKSSLTVDGILGRNTRTVAALFQVKISDPPKPTPWPTRGYDADADGILGRQSLTALGFDVQP